MPKSNFSHHHVAAELDLTAPAPPLLAAETPAGQTRNMALLEPRGYDPTTLSWSSIPANQPEDGPPNILAEQAVIFQVVESRCRRRQNARGAATSTEDFFTSLQVDAKANGQDESQRLHDLDLKTTFQQGELGAAISQLIGRQHMNAITISPNSEQNIIACGTPNPEVVQKLLTDFQLNTSKGPLPLHGHLKLTGDVCRGVISVHNLETSGELVLVRKLGNSNVAVLTFEGRNVPRYVHYNAELTPVREYKKTVPACSRCGTLGHRADNCPNPDQRKMQHLWPKRGDWY
ncbi:hypothetical protein HPB49_018224 [Dermacentor silvarum]|uniref:Uncharacterized protein n=1 Tax=Dermacentor silvarum TaxID=543639 RepID=A0ACB8CAM5_DERSI|nr:hypothetical protein HPB49_018224 [Dermacentor silvarum]